MEQCVQPYYTLTNQVTFTICPQLSCVAMRYSGIRYDKDEAYWTLLQSYLPFIHSCLNKKLLENLRKLPMPDITRGGLGRI